MRRFFTGFVLAVTLPLFGSATLSAQGVTTGAIAGTVTDAEGAPLVGAQVQIINRSTGFRTGTLTRSTGQYLVQGLEVGGPYTVSFTSIGYQTFERNDVFVRLSAATRVEVITRSRGRTGSEAAWPRGAGACR